MPRDLRPKNAYNLIRLLDLAIRWAAVAALDAWLRDVRKPCW